MNDPFDAFSINEVIVGGDNFVQFKKMRPLLLREQYMSFLLHLNEDFDDDLLMDALKILDCIS